MSRNRKSGITAAHLSSVIKVGLIGALLGGAGLAYVWQKNQIYLLAKDKKRYEIQLDKLRQENKAHSANLDYLRLPWKVEARAKELNLGLIVPQPEQILRLIDTPDPGAARLADRAGSNRPAKYGVTP